MGLNKPKGQAEILFLFMLFVFPLMILVLFLRSCEAHKYMELKTKQTELQILQYKQNSNTEAVEFWQNVEAKNG